MWIGIGKGLGIGNSINWESYWTALFQSIGFSHPMLSGLWLKKVAGDWQIQSHTIDDFRETYASPVVKYVDWENGNDGNTGNSWAQAYKTMAGLTAVAYDRAYFMPGNYATTTGTNIFGNTREMFGYGGYARMMRGTTGTMLTWVDAGGGVFTATYTSNPVGVYDDLYSDTDGDPIPVTSVADAATVATTPNSWYRNGGTNTLYVRLTDDRQPDNHFFLNTTYMIVTKGKTHYCENLILVGASLNNDTATLSKFLLKNCKAMNTQPSHAILVKGNSYLWIEDCLIAKTYEGDGITYGDFGGYSSSGVEVGVTARNCGIGNRPGISSLNCSSAHNSSVVLRVNGDYTKSEGPCVHDIDSVKSFNIGCSAGYSTSGVADYKSAYAIAADASGDDTTMWLYDCVNVDDENTYGAENREDTSFMYAHNSSITNIKEGTVLIPF